MLGVAVTAQETVEDIMVTVTDVARLAGVSTSTVSRVLAIKGYASSGLIEMQAALSRSS
jgi:DNA-binding MurR/RpiR family transcriptional regulator